MYKVKPIIISTQKNKGVDFHEVASVATGSYDGTRSMINCVKSAFFEGRVTVAKPT